jgi:hypothetical protein
VTQLGNKSSQFRWQATLHFQLSTHLSRDRRWDVPYQSCRKMLREAEGYECALLCCQEVAEAEK